MGTYRYLEDVAIADIAFEAIGKDLADVLLTACDATMNVMIEELDSIDPVERRELVLENEEPDMLLFDLLQELIYYKDAEQLLLRVENVKVKRRDGRYKAEASAAGERLNPEKHEQRADVKAVTLHQFSLGQTVDGWRAFVILDV